MSALYEFNRPRDTQLYPGDVTHLYRTPLPLYPNNSFVLDVTVEQDPMKVYPVEEMTTEGQRALWAMENGTYPSRIMPFLAQFRSVWALDFEDGETPTLYDRYYLWDPDPYAQYQVLPSQLRDLWWAHRSFIIIANIYSGDEIIATLDTSKQAVVWHSGYSSWSAFTAGAGYTPNGIPCDGLHAFTTAAGEPLNGLIFPYYNRGLGVKTWTGGNEWMDFIATVDGYGKLRIICTGAGREISIAFTVRQDQASCLPQSYGQNWGGNGEYFLTTTGAHRFDWANPIGALTYSQNQGWGAAAYGTADGLLGPALGPTQTVCTHKEFQIAAFGYSWDAIGDIPTLYDEGGAGSFCETSIGYSRMHTEVFSPPSESWEHNGVAASPLVVGSDKETWNNTLGSEGYGGVDAFSALTGGNYFNTVSDTQLQTLVKLWDALAKGRQEYSRVYSPPRIKVKLIALGVDQATSIVVADVRKFYYCDLPHYWHKWTRNCTLNDFVDNFAAGVDTHTNIARTKTSEARESTDYFTRGWIGIGQVSFGCNLNIDGASFYRFRENASLGPFYEGPDSYIYYADDPQTYETWAEAQGL